MVLAEADASDNDGREKTCHFVFSVQRFAGRFRCGERQQERKNGSRRLDMLTWPPGSLPAELDGRRSVPNGRADY